MFLEETHQQTTSYAILLSRMKISYGVHRPQIRMLSHHSHLHSRRRYTQLIGPRHFTRGDPKCVTFVWRMLTGYSINIPWVPGSIPGYPTSWRFSPQVLPWTLKIGHDLPAQLPSTQYYTYPSRYDDEIRAGRPAVRIPDKDNKSSSFLKRPDRL
jgi:hypothetical protein